MERADEFSIECKGNGAEFVSTGSRSRAPCGSRACLPVQVPNDETNLVCVGVRAAFAVAGIPLAEMPPLKYTVLNRIPFARGLGSSSAAIVGGLVAGLVLSGHKVPCWGEESLLQLACGIEGHPDNVAPAIYGGIQIGIHNGERWMSERVPTPPGLQASPA